MKRVTTMVLILAMVVSMLSGCGKDKGGNTSADGTKKVELSLSSADNTFGYCTDADLQKAVTKMLEEKTGTSLKTIIPPVSSYNEKVETMIAGGDVPDIFCVSQAMTKLPNYIARGKVLKLNDYIAKSEKLSSIPQELYDAISVDGGIYHIPYQYPKVKIIYLRKDIMEQYGINLSNTPTTEEFITEMSKLKGTGIIPFSFPKWIDNFQYFMNSFDAYAGIYQNVNGEYVDGFQEPQMMDALNYLRELYTNGIIDQEFITTENATMREYVYTGKAASALDYTTNYTNYVSQSKAAGAETDVYPIYAILGPNGKGGGLNESVQTAFAISADCKNPEKAIEVLETLIFDEEMYPTFFNVGVEGEHYTVDENGLLAPTEKAANSGYKPTYTFLYETFLDEFKVNFKPSPEIEASLSSQNMIMDEAQLQKGPKYAIPSGVSDTYDEVAASITSTWKEIVSQVVLGTVSVEEGMENYKDFWKSVNGDTILKELNGK